MTQARGNLGGVDEEVIPVLYADDAARAVAWYKRLGFERLIWRQNSKLSLTVQPEDLAIVSAKTTNPEVAPRIKF
jgi:hypothetical protein